MVEKEESKTKNPREAYAQPPFPKQAQDFPGKDWEMKPVPDHGEDTYRGSGKLAGKVALITGGDSGIGRAVALAFAREGADIMIAYLSEDRDAQETLRWVEKAGKKAILIAGDIGDEAHCQELVQRTIDEFGRIDILVNNAAYENVFIDITKMPSEEWRRTFRTNVDGLFYLCKAAIPHMKPGSSIINTTSTEAYDPQGSLLAYATTKGAIVTFTKALAKMVLKQGIRVNAVAPGPVWTPIIPATTRADQITNFAKSHPMGRPAQPAELAPVYVLLASDEASYISAGIYEVAGGKPVV